MGWHLQGSSGYSQAAAAKAATLLSFAFVIHRGCLRCPWHQRLQLLPLYSSVETFQAQNAYVYKWKSGRVSFPTPPLS